MVGKRSRNARRVDYRGSFFTTTIYIVTGVTESDEKFS